MSMMWFKDNAKWVIVFFAVLIIAGLVMMDRAGSIGNLSREHDVAKVDGEVIDFESFQRDMQNYVRSEEARSGKAPEGAQQAQMREGLLQYKIQSLLMAKLFKRYHLIASVEEMQEFLRHNPMQLAQAINQYEGPQAVPAFLRDSILDTTRYLAWLAQDSIYDRPGLRVMEEQLKNVVIPQSEMQSLLHSQLHRTTLEESYAVAIRETSAKLKFYHVSFDSITVDRGKFKEEDLKSYYNAHPDSFYFHEVAARMKYVRLPIQPSKHDTDLMMEFAKELKQRCETGEKFDELAKAYSNDPGSAEQGGRLGGFQPKSSWVPAFGEAAFALDSGAISAPVLTEFGVHLILSHGKQNTDSVVKADVSHILLKIAAGTETIDSLQSVAGKIREAAEAAKSLATAAKPFQLAVDSTPIFEKGNLSPLGPTYIPGLNSFAFSPYEKDAYSEPLQNEDGIYVFERGESFKKGRDYQRAKDRIRELLVQDEKAAGAKQNLESQVAAIKAQTDSTLAPRLGKAVLDSSALVSADNWVPGFGYASPTLFGVFQQPDHAWGKVLNTQLSAVIAKVVERKAPTTQEIEQKAKESLAGQDGYLLSNLMQEYMSSLPKTVKVVTKLDEVYRN